MRGRFGHTPIVMRLLVVVTMLVVLPPYVAAAQSIVYVDADNSGVANGTSWATAFVSLQDALAAAAEGDAIWIASGTYRPDIGAGVTVGDRDTSFVIAKSLSLYGGFAGSETTIDQRDPELYPAHLSGDLLENDDDSVYVDNPLRIDNSNHVVVIDPTSVNAVTISGLYVESGNANTTGYGRRGGGIRIVIPLNDTWAGTVDIGEVVIRKNAAAGFGGGIYTQGAAVNLRSSAVDSNSAFRGGGIYSDAAALAISDASFKGNSANGMSGSTGNALLTTFGRTIVKNVVFRGNWGRANTVYTRQGFFGLYNSVISGNTGGDYAISFDDDLGSVGRLANVLVTNNVGGGMCICAADVIATNMVIDGNSEPFNLSSAMWGGALRVHGTRGVVANSIIWDNTSGGQDPNITMDEPSTTLMIANSILYGTTPAGTTTLGFVADTDPHFADPIGPDLLPGTDDDNFSLLPDSPGIDTGDNGYLLQDIVDLDVDGDTLEAIPIDLAGNERTRSGEGVAIVDLGAYEVDPATTTDPDGHESHRFWAYPNPATNYVVIDAEGHRGKPLEVQLFDMLGRMVRHARGYAPLGLSMFDLPSGYYHIFIDRNQRVAVLVIN